MTHPTARETRHMRTRQTVGALHSDPVLRPDIDHSKCSHRSWERGHLALADATRAGRPRSERMYYSRYEQLPTPAPPQCTPSSRTGVHHAMTSCCIAPGGRCIGEDDRLQDRERRDSVAGDGLLWNNCSGERSTDCSEVRGVHRGSSHSQVRLRLTCHVSTHTR